MRILRKLGVFGAGFITGCIYLAIIGILAPRLAYTIAGMVT